MLQMMRGDRYKCTCPALFAGATCGRRKHPCKSKKVCPTGHLCKEDPSDFKTGYVCVGQSVLSVHIILNE